LSVEVDDGLPLRGVDADIRKMDDIRPPVEAVRLIQVVGLAADLIAEAAAAAAVAAALDGDADIMTAEDVGELGSDTAADAVAVLIRRDADRRRTEVGEVQRRVVGARAI